MWRETTKHERNARIWRDELEDFVPAKVLDFHVHVFDEASLRGQSYSCAGHAIGQYTYEELEKDLWEAFPGRQTAAVCFGFPEPKYDLTANNAYVAAGADRKRLFRLRLLDPHEDVQAVRQDLLAGKFLGIKPYPDYVGKADVNQVEIREMLPAPVVQLANELGLIIMLHIPRRGRLADPVNARQIVELAKAAPRAKLVLAHVGRAYYLKAILGQLEPLEELPNVYFDLAMLNNPEVLEYLFERFPAQRIVFGSDVPVSLAPGKSVEINNNYTYITPVPWHLSVHDEHHRIVFTSFLYEELRAIKLAVGRLGLARPFIEAIFWNNAIRLLESVK